MKSLGSDSLHVFTKKKALRDSAVLLSIQQFSLGQIVNLTHSVVGVMAVSHKHTSVIT